MAGWWLRQKWYTFWSCNGFVFIIVFILFALWVHFVCRATAEEHAAHVQSLKTLYMGMVHIQFLTLSRGLKLYRCSKL